MISHAENYLQVAEFGVTVLVAHLALAAQLLSQICCLRHVFLSWH